MSRLLTIGCIHEPCSRPGAIEFCREIKRRYRCNEVVFLGDINDFHAISFHAKHPDMPGPKDEFKLAYDRIQLWKRAFPNAKVVLGNHDRRVIRLAETVNIPSVFIRNYSDTWNTPNWEWGNEFIIDNVLYIHGDGAGGGINPAWNKAKAEGMSVVMAHHHKCAGVKYHANPLRRTFGMDVGALINDKSLAFAYAKRQTARSILGVGVVLEGEEAYWIPMPICVGQKYYDGNFS